MAEAGVGPGELWVRHVRRMPPGAPCASACGPSRGAPTASDNNVDKRSADTPACIGTRTSLAALVAQPTRFALASHCAVIVQHSTAPYRRLLVYQCEFRYLRQAQQVIRNCLQCVCRNLADRLQRFGLCNSTAHIRHTNSICRA